MNYFKTSLLLMLLANFTATTSVAASEHGNKTQGQSADRCQSALPDLVCAKAPSATFDQQGRLCVAWSLGGHVYVNHSDDLAKTFSPPVAINRTPENIAARGEHRPKIQVFEQHIYVSWTKKLNKRFTGDIRFSYSEDRGNTFSKSITINDNRDTISHRFDALGVNDKGDITISWLDKRDQFKAKKAGKDYNGAAVYYSYSTDGGQHFSTNKKIIDNSCECCRIAMDFDQQNLPVIMWRHIYGDNIRDHSITHFTSIDEPATPNRVSYDHWYIKGCPHHGPGLSIDNTNRYHAVWFNNAPDRHGIFYAYSADNGEIFSTPMSVGQYDKAASHAHVISHDNKVYIVWTENNNQKTQLYVMTSDDRGDSWSPAKRMAESQNSTDYAFLLKHKHQVYIAWHRPGVAFDLIKVE